ncbi:hypothetical protein CVV68_06780 [Arthrobacter livingstonensis]|uniref:Uncharacterized protein n=1 Tax=Arthrobacter livingstonensis TaxID=670078 RepID=A0A2V5LC88_9MICC|nr:hypothetical protein [Arthrobacter livingstonensis]PYI68502.1 hypothetical protein CVV68_06780 [Arthrobacter livingstonensis]
MSSLLPTIFTTTGLIGGFQTARATKNRQLGGAVLAVAGTAAFLAWRKNAGTGTAAALTAAYVLAFGASHPLAKKMGAWPAVYTVTAATAAASFLLGRKRS